MYFWGYICKRGALQTFSIFNKAKKSYFDVFIVIFVVKIELLINQSSEENSENRTYL